jgi:hypothetical protein
VRIADASLTEVKSWSVAVNPTAAAATSRGSDSYPLSRPQIATHQRLGKVALGFIGLSQQSGRAA